MANQETPRVSIVTGGAGGLGFPIAARLAAKGHKVALWDINKERVEEAAAKLPGAKGYVVNVMDAAAVEAATEQAVADLGPLGILLMLGVPGLGLCIGLVYFCTVGSAGRLHDRKQRQNRGRWQQWGRGNQFGTELCAKFPRL
ncbi:MAG: SDR family NAD(P)-dependent oxidoreductase [Chitinophagaceae bacterium]|nr:MAG: SDR family NAD(P)-dependent oxidoreductase [Chitinophagaceae bacterium]